MATITLRVGRTNPLTNQEIDDNFTNLNTDIGTRLLTSNFTGANILSKLLDVDIDASNLNASTLQGAAPDTANTANTIVERDASGNFLAGTITATFSGNLTGNVTGNVSGTVTNGVVTSGSYSNPTWITSLAGSKVTSIPNSSLTNNSISINGTSVALGGTIDMRSTANTFTADQTFRDASFFITNTTTTSKVVKFEVGSVVGTRTLTIPNSSGTIATEAYVTSATVSSANNLSGGRCLLQDGTVLLPALAFNSDQDTGLYWGGSGSIFFTANGTKSGQIVAGGDLTMVGNVTAYSDARLKENVVTVEDALSKVSKLRGVFYNKIADESKTRKLGVIAQEIQPILPEVVIADSDGILSVDYGNIVGLLIEAIKELQTEVQALKEAK